MKRLVLVALLSVVFWGCGGDETTTVVAHEKTGFDVAANMDGLGKCDSAHIADIAYVKDSAKVFFCNGSVWRSVDKRKPQSFDGEVFDVQHEDRGGVDYVSYARYRAHLGLNYAFFRLQLARDVLHWGPGYYNNLTLNQFALPYNMIALDVVFGPLRVYSAYADLRVNSWSYSKDNLNDRNMYAHRYELALGNLTVGMSELSKESPPSCP